MEDIWQGISFPDGMTLISGPEPGYYTDIMVWRDCDVRHDLEEIMHEREANGLCRLKLYADKLYNTSMLENAVSKYYHVAVLLSNLLLYLSLRWKSSVILWSGTSHFGRIF
jgi:hypothetical protein